MLPHPIYDNYSALAYKPISQKVIQDFQMDLSQWRYEHRDAMLCSLQSHYYGFLNFWLYTISRRLPLLPSLIHLNVSNHENDFLVPVWQPYEGMFRNSFICRCRGRINVFMRYLWYWWTKERSASRWSYGGEITKNQWGWSESNSDL